MSAIKGQHRGHCQRCGAIQVVLPDGTLAQHGYTVPNGYFKGACQGSFELPLQISRIITDAIILAMNDIAARNEVQAIALRGGVLKPEQVQRLESWGSRVYTIDTKGKSVPVMVAWSDAHAYERKAQVELDAGQAESDARFFRSHAKSMSELAEAVHGQPLIDRDAEELARKAERKAKTAPIAGAYRTKIEQKRALEELNRTYSNLARVIKDHYLAGPRDTKGDELYYAIPFDLHCWRAKHTALVLDTYPQLANVVEQIEILVINRNEIKARPVIK